MTTSNNPIHFANELVGDGTGVNVSNDIVPEKIKSEALTWVHLDADQNETEAWLKKEVDYLDQIIIDALLADETRPRMLEFESGALMILRGVNLNEKRQS